MSELAEWANNNSGWASILVFSLSIVLSTSVWVVKKLLSKPRLRLEDLKEPTFCSSFDAPGEIGGSHRTAFLIYLKITNIGRAPTQVGDIHLGYRSTENADGESFRWLLKETPMLEDFKLPMNDTEVKVFPFLKQRSSSINSETKTYLYPGEYVNGLVYFEQAPSKGLDYPYMDPDYLVITKIRVHDPTNNYWEIEVPIHKIEIDVIRKINPRFPKL